MRTRIWVPAVVLALTVCLPVQAGVVKSKRELLKERYQGKNILFNSNEQYESYYSSNQQGADVQLDAAQSVQVINQPLPTTVGGERGRMQQMALPQAEAARNPLLYRLGARTDRGSVSICRRRPPCWLRTHTRHGARGSPALAGHRR